MNHHRVSQENLDNQCRLAAPSVIEPNDEKCKLMRSSAMLSCIDCGCRSDRKRGKG